LQRVSPLIDVHRPLSYSSTAPSFPCQTSDPPPFFINHPFQRFAGLLPPALSSCASRHIFEIRRQWKIHTGSFFFPRRVCARSLAFMLAFFSTSSPPFSNAVHPECGLSVSESRRPITTRTHLVPFGHPLLFRIFVSR